MTSWFQYVRILHILCGTIALFVAPAAMLTVKGSEVHRRWGKIYFWMMAVVAVTAMAMALYRPIIFLALVAVFSFYFAFRGYRSVLRKNCGPETMDWIVALLALAGSLGLIELGIRPPTGQLLPAPPVSVAFGVIGIVFAGSDIQRFFKPSSGEKNWWYNHMGGMLGSYIATVSAFSAVNFSFLPIVVRWLWPSVIGIPGIFLWIAYYQKRFTRSVTKVAAV
jgi:uncharacterized membrane protein